MKPINYRPKVGEILECDFGKWDEKEHVDGHIPPEMRKRRMVLVINARLDGKSTIIVPISSHESNKYNPLNEPLSNEFFQVTDFYDKRERYALCSRVGTVSNKRLFQIFENSTVLHQKLPNEVITAIQKKIIKAINAQSLLKITEQLQAENEFLKAELERLKNT